jgi:hypothetical protein
MRLDPEFPRHYLQRLAVQQPQARHPSSCRSTTGAEAGSCRPARVWVLVVHRHDRPLRLYLLGAQENRERWNSSLFGTSQGVGRAVAESTVSETGFATGSTPPPRGPPAMSRTPELLSTATSNPRPHPYHRCSGGSQRPAPPDVPKHPRSWEVLPTVVSWGVARLRVARFWQISGTAALVSSEDFGSRVERRARRQVLWHVQIRRWCLPTFGDGLGRLVALAVAGSRPSFRGG